MLPNWCLTLRSSTHQASCYGNCGDFTLMAWSTTWSLGHIQLSRPDSSKWFHLTISPPLLNFNFVPKQVHIIVDSNMDASVKVFWRINYWSKSFRRTVLLVQLQFCKFCNISDPSGTEYNTYTIKNQQRQEMLLCSRGHFVRKPLEGGFGCLELVLYGIRELA